MSLIFKKIYKVVFSKKIWHINNDSLSRKFSLNTKKFSYKRHIKWLRKVLKKKTEEIYLVKKKNTIIGIIRCKKIKKLFYLSWSLDKKYRNKGYGKIMLKEFVESKNKTFFAKIKKENKASIHISKFAGFKLSKRKNDVLTFFYKKLKKK